ncbi:MBL fold metallo-hydrolase [Candidatus Woesebacteria bacterium]|nr:MBL fold metallo-hydrolase [Candidatus Woesebacteria bacterium]
MELKFLGTSSGWPLPRLGCKCNICRSNDPKDVRLRPSLLINDEVLIDASPDIYHQIKKYDLDPTKIKYIVLTHAHDDHIMGLFDLSHVYNNKTKPILISTKSVLDQVNKKLRASFFSFIKTSLSPFNKLTLGSSTDIWLIPVRHSVEAYAVKIKSKKPFLYAPEFRSIPGPSKKYIGDLDLMIIDGSSKTRVGQARGHETIEEGIKVAQELSAKKIYFTNIGHKTDTHNDLTLFVKEKGGDKFNIAFDGLELKL